MLIGGTLGQQLLTWISPPGRRKISHSPSPPISKIETHWGPDIWAEIQGKVVLDFGCGFGGDAIALAQHGAEHVIGLDIRPEVLNRARQAAEAAGVGPNCSFVTSTEQKADLITSVDAFEHFADPGAILQLMADLLAPGGQVLASFGPTWLHPLGGHGFSVFPWAHLVFTEQALVRWRSGFKNDGATRFHEISGGLNKLTIGRFRRLVFESPFKFASFETIPIQATRPLCNRLTRELFTSLVRCRLVKK